MIPSIERCTSVPFGNLSKLTRSLHYQEDLISLILYESLVRGPLTD